MRILKFRAWDDDIEQMLPSVDLSQPKECFKWLGVKDIKIMQFTSLLDKNGVEIWEGDIVRVNMKTDKDVVWLKRQAEIVWESPGFVLDYTRGLPGDIHIGRCTIEGKKDLEVIGNIFENPELLSKKL